MGVRFGDEQTPTWVVGTTGVLLDRAFRDFFDGGMTVATPEDPING